MKKKFGPIWIFPCVAAVLLLCFAVDERGEKKSELEPYMLSFSDNFSGYDDGSPCQLDALTPWDWDTVWFVPADSGSVKLSGLGGAVSPRDAHGDAPESWFLVFARDGAVTYVLSDCCEDAGYRLVPDDVLGDARRPVQKTAADPLVLLKTTEARSDGGTECVLTLLDEASLSEYELFALSGSSSAG